MKIILSRKGFDSSAGKQANPIMPDGTLLSMPIPSDDDLDNAYSTITWNNMSYYEIIRSFLRFAQSVKTRCAHFARKKS